MNDTKYEHQIYVSYADADANWAIDFIHNLKIYLRKQLNEIDDNFIWARYLLIGNRNDNTEMSQKEHLKQSKLVIVINPSQNQENITQFHSNHSLIEVDKLTDLKIIFKKVLSKIMKNLEKEDLEKIELKKTLSAFSLPERIVITVTDTETEAFHNVLKEQNIELTLRKHEDGGHWYNHFIINGVDCALIRPTEKGNTASQALVNKLVSHPPKLMLMTGICGGFKERKVKLNDVIFANSVFGYESERLTDEKYRRGIQPKAHRASPALLNFIANLKTSLKSEQGITIHHEKSLASGNKVLEKVDCDLRTKILDISPDIYGIEMEGVGFLHAIWDAQIQTDAAIIKAVSDFAGKDMKVKKETKQLEAATIAAKVTLEILKQFNY